jgi:hypothetical protein
VTKPVPSVIYGSDLPAQAGFISKNFTCVLNVAGLRRKALDKAGWLDPAAAFQAAFVDQLWYSTPRGQERAGHPRSVANVGVERPDFARGVMGVGDFGGCE